MKRKWVHRITEPPFIALTHTCAICRGQVRDMCIECAAMMPGEQERHNMRLTQDAQDTWFTLLLCARRAPLNRIPLDVIGLIYRHSTPDEVLQTVCPSVELYCHHVYHECCIKKWGNRFPKCPLDNKPFHPDVMEHLSEPFEPQKKQMSLVAINRMEYF